MKKFSLLMIAVWSFIGLTIIAVLMLSTVFSNRDGENSMVTFGGFGNSNLVVDETIPMQGLDEIELSLSSDKCNIYFSNDDFISVKHYARNIATGRYAKINTSGGVLSVSTRPTGLGGFTLFSFSSDSIVEVTLPVAYKESLKIDLMSGDIRFDGDLDLSELSVEVSSGTVRTDHILKAKDIDITVTSGSVKATGGIEADNYALKTSSGTINVDTKLVGSGTVNVTSGTIRLSGVDITEDLSVKVSSGTINIGIAGDPSLRYSGRRSSGTVRAYFNLIKDGTTFSGTVGEGPYKNLDVTVTSGTIRITQE